MDFDHTHTDSMCVIMLLTRTCFNSLWITIDTKSHINDQGTVLYRPTHSEKIQTLIAML